MSTIVNHRAKPGIVRRVVRAMAAILPKKIRRALFGRYWAARSPDRVFLVQELLPRYAARAGNILWIGCRDYTNDYAKRLERKGGVCWTIDIDPASARWGRNGRHVVGDVCDAAKLFPDLRFDTVLCNGIFGFGVNSREQQAEALQAIATILKPHGTLLLSWNTDRTPDPVASGLTQPGFEYVPTPGLDTHYTFEGYTHVYELLQKRS